MVAPVAKARRGQPQCCPSIGWHFGSRDPIRAVRCRAAAGRMPRVATSPRTAGPSIPQLHRSRQVHMRQSLSQQAMREVHSIRTAPRARGQSRPRTRPTVQQAMRLRTRPRVPPGAQRHQVRTIQAVQEEPRPRQGPWAWSVNRGMSWRVPRRVQRAASPVAQACAGTAPLASVTSASKVAGSRTAISLSILRLSTQLARASA